MLGGPRPRPAADAQVVVDRLEARHRAGGEPGSEALLLRRHGSGEARHAVLHVDVDTRVAQLGAACERLSHRALEDRKSTRLNSSHVSISYAVFCLKKK